MYPPGRKEVAFTVETKAGGMSGSYDNQMSGDRAFLVWYTRIFPVRVSG